MLLEKTKIYGVDGVGQSSPTLTRTNAAVGLSYTRGASEVVSDFDNCYPWSEMKEVVDEYGNVFIRIPKFYTKITKNDNGTYKHQISGCRYDGFGTLFVDGKGNELDYTYDELKEKMAAWLNRYNNRPHSSLRNREGKRVWLSPLQKRAELLEDYRKNGFKDENENEIKIRFLKKSA